MFSNTEPQQFSKGHWKFQQGGVTLFHSITPFWTFTNNLYTLNTLRIFWFLLLNEKPLTCESLLSTTRRTWLNTCSGIFKHTEKVSEFSSGAGIDKSHVYANIFFLSYQIWHICQGDIFFLGSGLNNCSTRMPMPLSWKLVNMLCYMVKGTLHMWLKFCTLLSEWAQSNDMSP